MDHVAVKDLRSCGHKRIRYCYDFKCIFSRSKVAVVTGCDTGLGQGMALGRRKRAVTLLALTSLNRLKPSAGHSAGASFFKPDRRSAKDCGIPALLDRAVAEFGHIDILGITPD